MQPPGLQLGALVWAPLGLGGTHVHHQPSARQTMPTTTETLQSIPTVRLTDGKHAFCLNQSRVLFRIPLVDGGLDVRHAQPADMERASSRYLRGALIAMELELSRGDAEICELALLAQGVEVLDSLSELDDVGPPLANALTGEDLEESEQPIPAEVLHLAERLVAARSVD